MTDVSPVDVSPATETDAKAWEDYLVSRGVSHHAYSWHWSKILPEAFGHQPYMLMARRGGTVVGVCPLYHFKSFIFGPSLISVPYLNAGGPIADDDLALKALIRHAEELSKQLDVRYLELREIDRSEYLKSKFPERSHKVTMLLPLANDAEALFASFPPKLRSQIRRPSKAGYFAQVSGNGLSEEESAKAFFRVFAEHMRDLGTPTYPRRLYPLVLREFKGRCRIITVWKDATPVAAALTIGGPFQGAGMNDLPSQTEVPWASSLRRFGKDSPNMLLYWEAIKTACADGFQNFDFGRSTPDSGTYRFKAQWGAEPRPLHWYYDSLQGALPDVNPENPKYELLVRCWKKLPLPVANTLGAWLSRSIP